MNGSPVIGIKAKQSLSGVHLADIWDKEEKEWSRNSHSIKGLFPNGNQYDIIPLEKPIFEPNETNESPRSIIFQDLYWSDDGMQVTAVTDDHAIRQYYITYDANGKINLQLTKRLFKNRSIVSSAMIPHDNSTGETLSEKILIGSRSLPIQLYSLKSSDDQNSIIDTPIFTYSTMNPQNEVYETPYSIMPINSDTFLVGSIRNSVSLYDMVRKEPIWNIRSDKMKCGKAEFKSIVSCFDETCMDDNYLKMKYFGTYKNEIYRIDLRTKRQGMERIYNTRQGNGIYQLLKSENGLYLYVLMRKSNQIKVYDIRRNETCITNLKLPFLIKNQKFKANISSFNGLSIGTNNNKIINWDRSIVESGGITRHDYEQDTNILPTITTSIEEPAQENEERRDIQERRINIIKQNPVYLDQTIISYSPDKTVSQNMARDTSGICLIDTP
ncbi:similar to Saccharomyces cerevisiae YNL187W SWT21 Protein involved in mRNA splicing [Maudiozyma saulgeensis]|uniref:Protein SWT21 n=1 Tax=Maudiozyma saulgeensis TaxID=1789683 RepID=A0A1X7R2A2_9SACH|nr:similar to Saccharomyces cerevisiae YNL187W SWT21 Protein involved in mRNA splicing [Kazachstania saulgeensis]